MDETKYHGAGELDPDDAEAWFKLGNVLSDRGDLDGAEQAFRTAIELNPKWAYPWYNLGNVLLDRGDLDGAEQSYRTAIELDPKLAYPWNGLGNVLSNVLRDRGDLDGAEQSYRTAIELDPKWAGPWYGLGSVLLERGDLDGAEQAFRTAIELNPKWAYPWYNLGNVLLDRGDLDGAEQSYRTAIEFNPKWAHPWYGLGSVLLERGDLDGAEQAFRTAIELNPKTAHPWHGLGNVLSARGDLDGAEQSYRTAIELDPKLALSWYNMAMLEQKKDGGPLVTAYLRRYVYLDGFLKFPRNRQAIFHELVDKSPHPIFVLKITEHLSHLLLSQQWSTARDQAQLAVAKPLSILNILKDDKSFESLFLRGLILVRFGDIRDDTFDVINDKYEENLLGQYYLLVFLNSLVMDTGPSKEEAQEYALSAENESSDAEQLFVAGLIFRFCEKDDHAANCWLKAGKHLASKYLLMLLRHDQENVNARDGLISKILKEENQRLKNGQVGFLRGQQLIDDIDFETEQGREQIVKCLRYDEVAFAVETLHNLVEENPRNQAWSRFAEEPVSRLKYGPRQLVDILAIKPEQREGYRDLFERNDELAQELFNKIKADTGSNPVERFGDVADDKYEDRLAEYLRDGADVDAVKQKMLAFLYQSRKLDAMPTMCLLLYLEQYRNRILTREKLLLYFTTIVTTIGAGTVSALLSSNTAVGVIGGGVGSLLGPALHNAIGNKVFTVRHEDYREFRQRMMEALTAAQSD